ARRQPRVAGRPAVAADPLRLWLGAGGLEARRRGEERARSGAQPRRRPARGEGAAGRDRRPGQADRRRAQDSRLGVEPRRLVARGQARPLPAGRGRQVNVLVLGGGGREHALAWKIARSPKLSKLLVAPGNPGTAELGAENVAIKADDPSAVVALARERSIDLVVVGPEAPLVAGVADALEA